MFVPLPGQLTGDPVLQEIRGGGGGKGDCAKAGFSFDAIKAAWVAAAAFAPYCPRLFGPLQVVQ